MGFERDFSIGVYGFAAAFFAASAWVWMAWYKLRRWYWERRPRADWPYGLEREMGEEVWPPNSTMFFIGCGFVSLVTLYVFSEDWGPLVAPRLSTGELNGLGANFAAFFAFGVMGPVGFAYGQRTWPKNEMKYLRSFGGFGVVSFFLGGISLIPAAESIVRGNADVHPFVSWTVALVAASLVMWGLGKWLLRLGQGPSPSTPAA